jgi:hypothetical protein
MIFYLPSPFSVALESNSSLREKRKQREKKKESNTVKKHVVDPDKHQHFTFSQTAPSTT